MKKIIRFLKDWTLPVAIAVGTVVYLLFYLVPFLDGAGDALGEVVDTIFPFMVFSTLFSTYCRIDFHQMRPHRWHVGVLLAQVVLVALNVWMIFRVEADPEQKLLWESVLTHWSCCYCCSCCNGKDWWQYQHDDGLCGHLRLCLSTDDTGCVPTSGAWRQC